MKGNVNFYFAMLIMFIAGVGSALIIIHIATANNFTTTIVGGSEASYSSLKQSILGQ